ncbi:putative Serine/threonine protein kinase [Candidatus Sulfotelmatobacter kueseliae]|uniref:Putative Serine/threonine protein kinase n=1 Tax=Candidatus Sulfotelmatobacter kueseliae TaxID=2042962 RepID=A0A2U3K2B2_9BACT|nr:putative Serine/threonine protein kinase [Candidatus Sulfotelmatobacter kueseliae]
MIGQTIAHYRIIEKIGAGGMGEVYRARDEHLARDVAIKVLPPGTLTDESARKHFRKEALILSQLNHPNVATIYDFDTQQGVDFLVMEYIPGITLNEKVAAGALPEKEVLRLGVQLAEGLAAAHEHGIVHRDLKPGNLRVTGDGRLKILDFGLAKLWRPVTATATTESLSETHAMAGTLPYMAPEQLLGEEIDARTDLHAAGLVLYEMATGRYPFADVEHSQLIGAILRRPPRPPAALNSRLSPELERIIGKCLEKEPENRYQSAKELAIDLRRLLTPSTVTRPIQRRKFGVGKTIPLAAACSVAVLLALILGLNPGGIRDRLFGRTAYAPIRSLAVLPLVNLSGDPEQEYFADGMTEALITDLSKIRALKVISRTSVMQFKDAKKPLPDIAQALGVDGILEGSVQRSGGRVRITAQLIRAATDTHLWAESYERDTSDVLTLQAEVAQAIAREIKAAVSPEETNTLGRSIPVDPDAYEAYLKGQSHWYQLSREHLDAALGYFELALQKQPTYARAYVGVANVWLERGDAGSMPPSEAIPQAKAAISKALALDGTLSEAHIALANIAGPYDHDWAAAELEFRRGLELNPNSADGHFMYADFLVSMKRVDEWNTEIHRTLELDPFNPFFRCFYGWHLVYLQRYDEAIAQFRSVLATAPEFSSAHMGLWGAYYKTGMNEEAMVEARKFFSVLHDREVEQALTRGYSESGYARAMHLGAEVLAARSKRTYVPAVRIARLYAHAGDKEQVLHWLQRACDEREIPLSHLGVAWDWDSVRSDPRFQDLLRRVGLPQ